jgi:hypothetical protein
MQRSAALTEWHISLVIQGGRCVKKETTQHWEWGSQAAGVLPDTTASLRKACDLNLPNKQVGDERLRTSGQPDPLLEDILSSRLSETGNARMLSTRSPVDRTPCP